MLSTRFSILRTFHRFLSNSAIPESRYFRVLGIETSCDDTCAAVVDSKRNILGETKYSQSKVHAIHGGIIPEFAQVLHMKNLKKAVDEALEKSELKVSDLDAVAVTVKPGLALSLEVGIECAKEICTLYSKHLIPIHHMEAHALTVRLTENVNFPFLVLLISGGHCILALAKSVSKYIILGETLDVAPGVLFDKVSRRLKLRNMKQYMCMQGGVALESASKNGNPSYIKFVRSNCKRDCNFHFSGFENSIQKFIQTQEQKLGITGDKVLPNIHDICASFQYNVTKYICERVEIAMGYLESNDIATQTLVASGGVASNSFIRKMLKHVCDERGYEFLVPPINLCTDNAVMVAWNGIERLQENMPTIPPDQLHLVELQIKSQLGESVADKVSEMRRKTKYVQLSKYIQTSLE